MAADEPDYSENGTISSLVNLLNVSGASKDPQFTMFRIIQSVMSLNNDQPVAGIMMQASTLYRANLHWCLHQFWMLNGRFQQIH